MSKKVKKKVSSVLMNEVVKELKLRGVKISDDDVDHLRSKNIVATPIGGRGKDPFVRLHSIITTSAKAGSHGGSTKKIEDTGRSTEEIKEIIAKKSKYLDPEVTVETLKKKFELDQEGLDYWSGKKIDPMRIFTQRKKHWKTGEYICEPYYGEQSAMMSADRVGMIGTKKQTGYTLKNIVITISGINKMRGSMEHDKFVLFLHRQDFPINPKLKPLLEKLLKKENKEL